MNKEQTLELFAKGKAAWNEHVRSMLQRNRPSLADGSWDERAKADFGAHLFSEPADFKDFHFPGAADFSKATFNQSADFSRVTFDGLANFEEAVFEEAAHFVFSIFNGVALFDCAKFKQVVSFIRANLKGGGQFDKALFADDAVFSGASFEELAFFSEAEFKRIGAFDGVRFNSSTTFSETHFFGSARFTAAFAGSTFTLANARFSEIPDFIQAHFEEAPRLDNVSIPEAKSYKNIFSSKQPAKSVEDYAARYRALKRMAVQGHDHLREQDFFAGELKASRGYRDKLWHARWWFGLLYQILSNFGRSMILPLLWWALAIGGFGYAYFAQRLSQNLAETCVVGSGKAFSAAVGLSLRKALPFPGVGSAEKLHQIYACLYGIHGGAGAGGELPARFTPIIPDAVDYLGMLQTLLSLLLLFLFLMAVRNHFRIK